MAAVATIAISNITSSTINIVVTAYSTANTTGPWYFQITTNNGMGGSPTYQDHPTGAGTWYSPDSIPVLNKTYTVALNTLWYNPTNPNTNFVDSAALSRMYYSPFNVTILKNGATNSNPGTFILTAPYTTQITAGADPNSGGGIACFTAGTQILTPTGYKAIETINAGDIVLTADARPVPAKLMKTNFVSTKETAPFLVPKATFGLQQDLRLSPWHAFQIKKGLWMKPQTASELYDTVKQYDVGKQMTYYHLETPNYFKDNLVANGTTVESFANQQLKNITTRPYTYNATLKAYTRISGKPTKALTQ